MIALFYETTECICHLKIVDIKLALKKRHVLFVLGLCTVWSQAPQPPNQTAHLKIVCMYFGLHKWFSGKESVCQMQEIQGMHVWSLSREDDLEEETATHFSNFAWIVPMDREVWWAIVHGVTKIWTWLSKHAWTCMYVFSYNLYVMCKLKVYNILIWYFPLQYAFMANRWGNSGWLYFSGLQNHCRWWLQPWN